MDNINLRNMHLAYQAVYNQELREEFEEINEDFLDVDYLTEESLEDIAEEVIYEMLGEGYDLSDIEDIFEEFILEARVTYGKDTPRPATRLEKIAGALKGAFEKVKGSTQNALKSAKQQSHIGLAKYASGRNLMPGAGLKTQSSAGRGQLRTAVAKDVASRVQGKIGGVAKDLSTRLKGKIGRAMSAVRAGATAAKKEFTGEAGREAEVRKMNRMAKRSAREKARQMSSVNPFNPKALPPGRTTKSGKPFNVGQYQMRSGMQNRKLKQRLGEDLEAWVNELLDEGYDLSDYTWDELGEIYEERVNLYQPRSATYQRRQGRPSPAVQAMNKSRELQTTEPGSDRQKRQTRAFKRLAGAHTDALRAQQDRNRRAQNESYDLYDVIASYLIDEGYADTLEGAEAIMVNMSEDWKETICEVTGRGRIDPFKIGSDHGEKIQEHQKMLD